VRRRGIRRPGTGGTVQPDAVLNLVIAIDGGRIPDPLEISRQRAPRQMGNNIVFGLHITADLMIAVGIVPDLLHPGRHGPPAAVRLDGVLLHECAADLGADRIGVGSVQRRETGESGPEQKRLRAYDCSNMFWHLVLAHDLSLFDTDCGSDCRSNGSAFQANNERWNTLPTVHGMRFYGVWFQDCPPIKAGKLNIDKVILRRLSRRRGGAVAAHFVWRLQRRRCDVHPP
jgi:hypothetical protein